MFKSAWLHNNKLKIYGEILNGANISIREVDKWKKGISHYIYVDNKSLIRYNASSIMSVSKNVNFLSAEIKEELFQSLTEDVMEGLNNKDINTNMVISKNNYIKLMTLKRLLTVMIDGLLSSTFYLPITTIKIIFPNTRPKNVTKIHKVSNQELKWLNASNFPNLTHLSFDRNFNIELNNSLSSLTHLTHLTFSKYEHQLGNSFTNLSKLNHLSFQRGFNLPMEHSLWTLDKLQELNLGITFNQKLDDSLDKLTNLTYLYFGTHFNMPLDNSLDKLKKLTHLRFGARFDQPLNDVLNKLKTLTSLSLSFDYDQSLNDTDFSNLKKLTLFNNRYHNYLNVSLVNLTHLKLTRFGQKLGSFLNKLPNLLNLTLGGVNGQPLGNSLVNLKKLTHLKIWGTFTQSLGDSLNELTELTNLELNYSDSKPLENSLNNLINLTHLKLGGKLNYPLDNSLDNLLNLTHLELAGKFNQPLGEVLIKFKKLTHLSFGYRYTQPIEYLPPNLMVLLYNGKKEIISDIKNRPTNLQIIIMKII